MDMRGYSLDESPEAPLLRAEPEQSLRCAHCSDNVGSVSSARTLHAETFPRGPQPDIRVDPIIVVGRFIVFVTSLAGIIVQSVDIPQDPRVAGLFALTLITFIYSIGTLGVHILLGHLSATTRQPRFPELSFTCGLSWYTGDNDRGITRGRKRQFQCPLLGLTDLALAIPLLIFTILVADKMSRDRYYHNERRLVAITTLGSISTYV